MVPIPSTSNLLAGSAAPEELRRALGQQALWLDRQKIHNESTHARLTAVEVHFTEIVERLDAIASELTAARAQRALWMLAAKAAIAIASLAIAAHAAGIL